MQNRVDVNVSNTLVGELYKENDEFIFRYFQSDGDFVSLTMPPRALQYVNSKLHPLFEMNLPEGYLLSIIKKHFSKVTKTDDFGLLKLMSKSINTRLTYNKTSQSNNTLTLDSLLQSTNLFGELVDRFALSSALSGVQPKVLATIEDKATLKCDEYIVKTWGEEYPQLALNEYYCMKFVSFANITVPEFYISSDEKLFVMKRFDIADNGTRLGFEDMCVLQAKSRDEKYEGSYEQVVKTIKTFVSPKYKKSSLREFFKMMVVNNIIQNGDAHLKNYGLLYSDEKNIKLSPAYDIVSTTAYIKNDISALHFLGSKKWWSKKYLLRFATESCEFSKQEAQQLYDEVINASQKLLKLLQIREKTEKNNAKLSIIKHLISLVEGKN